MTPHTISSNTELTPSLFVEEISAATAGISHVERCIQCGTCGGACPSSEDMQHTPRALFAMIKAGMREEVLSSNTPWICVSCYTCVVRCPQEIKITDVMYAVKGMAIRERKYTASTGPDFSMTFIDMVENYGRSHELGLAARHYLKHFPMRLPGMAPMGLGMLSKKRMEIAPRRIEGIAQLKSILARAKEVEASL